MGFLKRFFSSLHKHSRIGPASFSRGGAPAPPNAADTFSASSAWDIPSIKEYLARGGDINVRGPGGGTPLLLAAQGGREEAVRFLLKHGAAVNIQTDSGLTALMQAAREHNTTIVKMLIRHGADVDITDRYGSLAIDMVLGRCPEIEKMLSKRSRVKRTPAEGYDRTLEALARKAEETGRKRTS